MEQALVFEAESGLKCFYQPREHSSVRRGSLSVQRRRAALFAPGSRTEKGTSTVISDVCGRERITPEPQLAFMEVCVQFH